MICFHYTFVKFNKLLAFQINSHTPRYDYVKYGMFLTNFTSQLHKIVFIFKRIRDILGCKDLRVQMRYILEAFAVIYLQKKKSISMRLLKLSKCEGSRTPALC